jgi:bis(5'-nucleosidyl)-tetraphosphatase
MSRPLIIVSGPTEAGKSTLGEWFEERGALRVKVPRLLSHLKSGWRLNWRGHTGRYLFSYFEFRQALERCVAESDKPYAVIESFIDPFLLMYLRRHWTSAVRSLVVTSPLRTRIKRQHSSGTDRLLAMSTVRVLRKDCAKGWPLFAPLWLRAADVLVDNAGSRSDLISRLLETRLDEAMRGLMSTPQPVRTERSAGVVAYRLNDGRKEYLVLFQVRKNGEEQWVFPKGHIESGESAPAAALRELTEEAGISACTTERALGETVYVFDAGGERVQKAVAWFLVRCDGATSAVPRAAEGFREARWLTQSAARGALTHDSDRALLNDENESDGG